LRAIAKRNFHWLTADKVKSLSPEHQFISAKHSPAGIVETGLPIRLAEKERGMCLHLVKVLVSLVQFAREIRGIATIS
jgi:hypothetical protein